MVTGIYEIAFESGRFYIGQSVDIDKRWKQHEEAIAKRTHAKLFQREADNYAREYRVLAECHKDWLDVLEGYFIHLYLDSGKELVNTSSVKRPHHFDLISELLEHDIPVLQASTCAIVSRWIEDAHALADTQQDLQAEKDSHSQLLLRFNEHYMKVLAEIDVKDAIGEAQIAKEKQAQAEAKAIALEHKLARARKMNLWDRVFNYIV